MHRITFSINQQGRGGRQQQTWKRASCWQGRSSCGCGLRSSEAAAPSPSPAPCSCRSCRLRTRRCGSLATLWLQLTVLRVCVWVCVCSVCGCALGKCCSFVCCLFYNSFFNARSLAGLRCDFCRRHCRVVPSLTLLCGACDPHPLHVHVL